MSAEHVFREVRKVGLYGSLAVCAVCGQEEGTHDSVCPQVRSSQRAFRIEVDYCEQCPFANVEALTCKHPTAVENGSPVDQIIEDWKQPPPDWCPLRVAVTMIGGPADKAAFPEGTR